MNKQDSMKLQTCVLRVNIQCACDGCKQKIKTVLNKIDGVHKTNIDLEQAKVTVYGNADPLTLIKKLNKSGKHAELWGPHKGGNQKGNQQMQATPNKGFKDFNPSNNNQKSVKFDLPVGGGGGGDGGGGGGRGGGFNDEDDGFDDEFDEDDDSCDDGYDYKKPNKMMTGPRVGGYGSHGPAAMMNGKNGPSGGFDLPVYLKGNGGNNNDANKRNGGKMGSRGGDSGIKGGKKSKGGGGFGGFFGGMIGRALFGGGKKKHGVANLKGGKNGGGGGGGWQMKGGGLDKKGGKSEVKFSGNKQNEFLEFSKPQNGSVGRNMGHNGGNGGRNNNKMGGNLVMGQMGNYPMGQIGGHPMGQMPLTPMAYRGQGVDHGNPYNQQYFQQQYQQQQYTQPMMMMNQHKANMYPQMMYGQPPIAPYGPPMGAPMNDSMSHMFSDENTDSCSIM